MASKQTWRGGLRVSTSSSAAGATALIAVIVQTGCGFLSGGRRGATLDDRDDCFGRATVALRKADLRRTAAEQEQLTPGSFALENSWPDTTQDDKVFYQNKTLLRTT